jgi:hypothetical protein
MHLSIQRGCGSAALPQGFAMNLPLSPLLRFVMAMKGVYVCQNRQLSKVLATNQKLARFSITLACLSVTSSSILLQAKT